MYCSKCGTPNADAARFCERCGAALGTAPPTGPAADAPVAPAPSPQPSNAGWQANPQAGAYADPRVRGGARIAGAGGKSYATGKNPALAAILSFFLPAVGQFYNGDAKKGLLILLGYFISFMLTAAGIGFVTGLGIWVYSIIDAYNVASGKSPIY